MGSQRWGLMHAHARVHFWTEALLLTNIFGGGCAARATLVMSFIMPPPLLFLTTHCWWLALDLWAPSARSALISAAPSQQARLPL